MSERVELRTAVDVARAVGEGAVSAAEIVESYLEAATRKQHLGALCHFLPEAARLRAKELDERKRNGGALGPLAGVPIAVKDAICTAGQPTTAGSRMLQARRSDGSFEPYRPPYSATVVSRLEEAGAVLIGKANMDEFAMGSSNETSAYGPVANPWDESRVPGGSSGGSAAAVAAGIAPVALGSDTGGSIRQPAAFCGVVGVKPTYGRVSRYGLIAFASSLDQIGPMTPDVRSAARVMEVISGRDARDSTCSTAGVGAYEAACDRGLAGLRFGLPSEYFQEGLDDSVRACLDRLIEELRRQGCSVSPVNMPHTHYGVATYYVLATAEASSNLSRFDGVRFGLRVEEPGADLARLYEGSRAAGFGREVQRRILLGTYALSAGYYDAYYGKAQQVRTLIVRDFQQAFSEVDVLLTPTSPTVAFRSGERVDDPLSMYMADVYTLPASLAGVAGISVPCGTAPAGENQLPVGVQLLCPHLAEERLFQAAAAVEQVTAQW